MKRIVLASLTLLLASVGIVGCAAPRQVTYVDGDGKKYAYSDTDSYDDLDIVRPMYAAGEQYAIKKDADTRYLLAQRQAESLKAVEVIAPATIKTLRVINNDPSTGFYFYHPEVVGLKMYVKPKGYQLAEVLSMPSEITVYADNGSWKKVSLPKKDNPNLHHGGVKIDRELIVNRIY